MKSAIAVIGLGVFGREVAISLAGRNYSVLAIDKDPVSVEAIKDEVDQALALDTTDENALYEAKLDQMSIVINAIGIQNIENSILTTALLKQLEVPRIIARATNSLHGRILLQVGASEIVNPEQDMARRMAHQIARPGLREVLSLAEGVCVAEVPAPQSFVGKTLAGLDVRRRYGVMIVGVQRVSRDGSPVEKDAIEGKPSLDGSRLLDQRRRLILNISPRDDSFNDDDTLVVIGKEDDVNRLSELG